MLINIKGSKYFDPMAVIGVEEFKFWYYSKEEEENVGVPGIRLCLNNKDAIEIPVKDLKIEDVVKIINEKKEEERKSFLLPLESIKFDLNRLYELMAQDGVRVQQI
jgi:hypothetical protein